jgi:hypothetical protein
VRSPYFPALTEPLEEQRFPIVGEALRKQELAQRFGLHDDRQDVAHALVADDDRNAHRDVPCAGDWAEGKVVHHRRARVENDAQAVVQVGDGRQGRSGRPLQVHHLLARGHCEIDVRPVRLGGEDALGYRSESLEIGGGEVQRRAERGRGCDRAADLGVHRGHHGKHARFHATQEGRAVVLHEKNADDGAENRERNHGAEHQQREVRPQPHARVPQRACRARDSATPVSV